MKKKITSMLLCLVMIFSMLSFAVPINAASVTSTQLTVTADKTTAAPGDTINYTITMVLLEQVMTIDQKLLIKEYGEIGEQDRKSVERALKVSFGLLHSKKKKRRK